MKRFSKNTYLIKRYQTTFIHDIHDVIFYTEASEITGTSGKITKELVANFATSSGYFWVLPYKRLRHEYHELLVDSMK